MHDRYAHLTLHVERSALGPARQRLAAAAGGAVVVGAWFGVGSIGWYDDEATVLLGWPDTSEADAAPADALAATGLGGLAGVEVVAAASLRATARPGSVAALRPGGVFAQRWFEVDPADWDEFLTLSTEAWPAFESSYDTSIEGLFRGTDDERLVLLLTRYASIAEWERSRGTVTAREGDPAEAGRRFLRRREITRRSIVRVAPLMPSA